MTLSQAGGGVSGKYTHDTGRITNAKVTGNLLKGRWSEAPSYSGPNDAGDFEFTLGKGGKAFTGRWNYHDLGNDRAHLRAPLRQQRTDESVRSAMQEAMSL